MVGAPEGSSVAAEPSESRPMSTLRGARVAVDGRKIGRVVVTLCLGAMAAVAVILLVAGIDKNAQINELRTHGVIVGVKVTGCQGLLGGSGSNAAGYACRGSYTYRGHRYDEAIPGTVLRAPGATLRAVIAPSDPALVSTVGAVRSEHPSWRVFIAPAVLGLLAIGTSAVSLIRRRKVRSSGRAPSAFAASAVSETGAPASA